MKATDLLVAQHKEIARLFKAVDKAARKDQKRKLFEELAANLCAHDAIEREIFYPACEAKMGLTDLLGEAIVEHGVVEFCLYEADHALGENTFDFKVTVLREVVEHHVKEEQGDFFPKARHALGAASLAELGERMEARFEAAKARDFRRPLLENLRQVLEGTIKPVKGNQQPERRKISARSS